MNFNEDTRRQHFLYMLIFLIFFSYKCIRQHWWRPKRAIINHAIIFFQVFFTIFKSHDMYVLEQYLRCHTPLKIIIFRTFFLNIFIITRKIVTNACGVSKNRSYCVCKKKGDHDH